MNNLFIMKRFLLLIIYFIKSTIYFTANENITVLTIYQFYKKKHCISSTYSLDILLQNSLSGSEENI